MVSIPPGVISKVMKKNNITMSDAVNFMGFLTIASYLRSKLFGGPTKTQSAPVPQVSVKRAIFHEALRVMLSSGSSQVNITKVGKRKPRYRKKRYGKKIQKKF